MSGRIQNSKFKIQNGKGLFVSFEGIEGCGKTTQASLLAKWLKSQGHQVVVTREPGGPPIAEKIRKVLLDSRNHHMSPLAELLLLQASRAQHLAQVIIPALKTGKIVICDRFADSSTAYQGYGRGMDLEMVKQLNQIAVDGCWPKLTLVFDLPVELGFSRAAGRKRALDRMEQQQKAFHRKVRRGFLAIAKADPARVKVLDGSQLPDVIQAAVRQLVLNCLK
ncbi:dTMP kinase [candidate division TA06 bacterium]|uniref:Thymidylate kinase n=1 Tax=candidate division TA06 bacterium TaxID=2250710 RepID=A0A933IAN9_UNCT6|nr:dTMP kinase [candidate division TA06 bacterium]